MRLARGGRKKKPIYSIVIADARSPRDGRFIDKIGQYNPNTIPATINLDNDKALEWLMKGAQPTNTVRAILSFRGVLYKKHLQRGVAKGAFSQEEADKKFEEWYDNKTKEIDSRRDKHKTDLMKKNDEIIKAGAEKAAAQAKEREAALAAEQAEEAAELSETESKEAASEPVENTTEAEAMAEVKEEIPATEAKQDVIKEAKEEEE